MITRPHAGGEAELDVVGPPNRLVLIGEALDGDHRAEDLVLDRLIVLLHAGDDRRLVEEPTGTLAVTAGEQPGVVGQPVDHAADPLELVGVVERAVEDVRVVRHASLRSLGLFGQRGAEIVGDPCTDQHTGSRGAVLAGVEVPTDRDVFGRELDVGVVEHHDRGLAA